MSTAPRFAGQERGYSPNASSPGALKRVSVSRQRFLRRLIASALTLCVVLTLGAAVASGDGAAEQPETYTVRLQPGGNYVGWTEAAAPVDSLFSSVPQIQGVWAWDADQQRFQFAAPAVPAPLWTLRDVAPGMSLVLRIGGERPVDWERMRRPAQGTVELQSGWNLVSWLGRDGAPLDWVVRGIGGSLERVGLWSEEGQGFDLHELPMNRESSATPQLAFGAALWVKVSRPVIWLQPTGVLPTIQFFGEASPQTQENFRSALETTLFYFADTFAVQADPATLKVTAYGTYQQYLDKIGTAAPEYFEPSFWTRGGWGSATDLFAHESNFAASDGPGLSLMVHEYAHVVQSQLSPAYGWLDRQELPFWIIEGQAEWTEHHIEIKDDRSEWNARVRSLASTGPTLDDAPYTVGAVAVELLRREHGPRAMLEYWRLLTTPDASTGQTIDWRQAFHQAFAENYASFLERFREYHADIAGDIGTLTLKFEDGAGAPLAGWTVRIWIGGSENRFYITDEQGLVETALFADRMYRIGYGPENPALSDCWFEFGESSPGVGFEPVQLGHSDRLDIVEVVDLESLANRAGCE
ncbi:MAG: hypothetical protein F4Y35_03705 [Chloroflexi bacterium]|nr:hypothetical protein [Chloroflexota bacterium]